MTATRDRLIARRKSLGFTQGSLAYAISCERTTVARWERGESEVSVHLRGPLAEALQWTLDELDDAINGRDLARPSQGWWSHYVTLEQSATSVRTYEPVLIPGLLQTRDYAAALLGDNDGATRRLDRQRMITRLDDPVELVAVIDESVLLRPIGGPEVLAAQLRHLALMSQRPNVTLQVLPLDAPAQPAHWGALVLLGFRWSWSLVYLEHHDGARYLDSPLSIKAHTVTFNRLRELALSPDESVERIHERAGGTHP